MLNIVNTLRLSHNTKNNAKHVQANLSPQVNKPRPVMLCATAICGHEQQHNGPGRLLCPLLPAGALVCRRPCLLAAVAVLHLNPKREACRVLSISPSWRRAFASDALLWLGNWAWAVRIRSSFLSPMHWCFCCSSAQLIMIESELKNAHSFAVFAGWTRSPGPLPKVCTARRYQVQCEGRCWLDGSV
jgi:hypothetical protein